MALDSATIIRESGGLDGSACTRSKSMTLRGHIPRCNTDRSAHPLLSRRAAIQAGATGLLGLGMGHLDQLRSLGGEAQGRRSKAKSVIFIFASGGMSHIDTFDLKPDAPDSVRGPFRPIATHTPGLAISEHLPLLAQRSQ